MNAPHTQKRISPQSIKRQTAITAMHKTVLIFLLVVWVSSVEAKCSLDMPSFLTGCVFDEGTRWICPPSRMPRNDTGVYCDTLGGCLHVYAVMSASFDGVMFQSVGDVDIPDNLSCSTGSRGDLRESCAMPTLLSGCGNVDGYDLWNCPASSVRTCGDVAHCIDVYMQLASANEGTLFQSGTRPPVVPRTVTCNTTTMSDE